MRTIKLSFDQEEALKWVIKVCLKNYDMELGSRRCDGLISLFNQIQNAPDDTKLVEEDPPPTKEELEEMGLEACPQCDEVAWDGYICQMCGLKEI